MRKQDKREPCRMPTPKEPEEEVQLEIAMEFKREKNLCLHETHSVTADSHREEAPGNTYAKAVVFSR